VRVTMGIGRRRHWVFAVMLALAVPLLRAPLSSLGTTAHVFAVGARSSTAQPGPCDGQVHWVGAWVAAPQDTSALVPARAPDGDTTPETARASFTDQSFRMIVTPHVAGSELRVRLANRFGNDAVTFDTVHVGHRQAGASVAPGTDHVVTFAGGGPAVTLGPGTVVVSDPVNLAVDAFHDLAISFYVAGTASLDVHPDAQQTQYLTSPGAGDHTADTGGAAFGHPVRSWLAVTGVDVLAPESIGAIAVVGDSLTDGLGSTIDATARWTDDLARRALGTGAPIAVLNGGISGNQVARDNLAGHVGQVRGAGLSAVNRLDADALQQSGVRAVVVYAGINDLFAPSRADPVRAVVAGYQAMIDRAHTAGLRVVGATLTPAGQDGPAEWWRQAINEWIRTSGGFDAVIDLDAAVRDPVHSNRIASGLTNEIVHFNDTGYRALAASIDLGALRASGCTGRADS
jgi:lysophospholipase L1-like esterase